MVGLQGIQRGICHLTCVNFGGDIIHNRHSTVKIGGNGLLVHLSGIDHILKTDTRTYIAVNDVQRLLKGGKIGGIKTGKRGHGRCSNHRFLGLEYEGLGNLLIQILSLSLGGCNLFGMFAGVRSDDLGRLAQVGTKRCRRQRSSIVQGNDQLIGHHLKGDNSTVRLYDSDNLLGTFSTKSGKGGGHVNAPTSPLGKRSQGSRDIVLGYLTVQFSIRDIGSYGGKQTSHLGGIHLAIFDCRASDHLNDPLIGLGIKHNIVCGNRISQGVKSCA